MYKGDLALNNQQELICHKTQPNQIHQLCVDSGFQGLIMGDDL